MPHAWLPPTLALALLAASCGASKVALDAGAAADARPAEVGDAASSHDVRADTAFDASEKSPGSVTLQLTIASTSSYCDQGSNCDFSQHIFIRESGGRTLVTALPFCQAMCTAQCFPPPCPGVACFPTGTRFTEERLVWTGVYYEGSSCGGGAPCYNQRFAPPGRYVAVMCGTPGTLSMPDGGNNAVCTKDVQRCVEVPFDFPSTNVGAVVEGRLM
jgi:hypothetical protein